MKYKKRKYKNDPRDFEEIDLMAPSRPDDYHHTSGDDYRFHSRFVIPVVLNRDENKCSKCGATENLIVHHNSYDPDISINDLTTLCRKCHQNLHKQGNIEADEFQTDLF